MKQLELLAAISLEFSILPRSPLCCGNIFSLLQQDFFTSTAILEIRHDHAILHAQKKGGDNPPQLFPHAFSSQLVRLCPTPLSVEFSRADAPPAITEIFHCFSDFSGNTGGKWVVSPIYIKDRLAFFLLLTVAEEKNANIPPTFCDTIANLFGIWLGEEEEISPPSETTISFREEVKAFQRSMIQKAVQRHNGNWVAAARYLGMNRSNLHNLAIRLGMR